jgi:hypothetical protein
MNFRAPGRTLVRWVLARVTPRGPVVEDADGALYGLEGGLFPATRARFFRVSNGAIEFFHQTTEREGRFFSRLSLGADGALYGTVSEGPFDAAPADVFAGGVFRLVVPPRK